MSRIGWKGSVLKIIRAGEVLAAVRTKTVVHVRTPIDRSDEERDGWRHLDPRLETTAVEVSVEGVATSANYRLLEEDWLGNTFTDIRIGHPDGTVEYTEDGAFLQSLTYGGERAGAVSFQASFVLSGEVLTLGPIVLTSQPYALDLIETMGYSGAALGGKFPPVFFEEVHYHGGEPLAGELRVPRVEYDHYDPEEVHYHGGEPLAGELRSVFIEYQIDPEEVHYHGGEPLAGELRQILFKYENYDPEEVHYTGQPLGGALSS